MSRSARFPRYRGNERPAWRMNHTGVASTCSRRRARDTSGGARRSRLFQRPQQVTDRLCLADRLCRKAHAECPLDAQDELGPAEAVDAQIALDPTRRSDIEEPDPLRVQFAHEFRDNSNQVARALVLLGRVSLQMHLIEAF